MPDNKPGDAPSCIHHFERLNIVGTMTADHEKRIAATETQLAVGSKVFEHVGEEIADLVKDNKETNACIKRTLKEIGEQAARQEVRVTLAEKDIEELQHAPASSSDSLPTNPMLAALQITMKYGSAPMQFIMVIGILILIALGMGFL